jgi:hypothetical protein
MAGAETCSIRQVDVQMLIRLAVVKIAAADIANVGAPHGVKPRGANDFDRIRHIQF